MLDDDKKKNFFLRAKHICLINTHLTAKATFERSTQAQDPIVQYPDVKSLSLENSILSLNQKIELSSLESMKLLKDSTLQSATSRYSTLKHLELDNYKNPGCLGDMTLDTVVIDGSKGTNEGLILLVNLMKLEVCVKNKVTTVKVKTLYTPWDPVEVESNAIALDKFSAGLSDVSGAWNDDKN
jgi:hypothetical protein